MAGSERLCKGIRVSLVLAAAVCCAWSAALAGAVPTISKVFTPDTIGPGSSTTLVFTLSNPDVNPVTDLAFTDSLPAGVTIATPSNASTDCPDAVLSAPNGGGTITFSDGSLGASSSCTVSVDVTSSSVGTHMNMSSALSSSAGMGGSASDDLMVVNTLPGFTKVFSPSTIPLGGRSTLTFTIDNSMNGSVVPNLDFTDVLPTGLVIAEPSNASTTCGTTTIPPSLTAVAGTSVITLDADGTMGFPAVAASSMCMVFVDVVSTGAGTLGNISGDLLAEFVTAGRASNVLNVTVTEIALIKEFTDDPVPQGSTATLEFTIRNFSRDFTATSITFSDDLTSVLAGLTASGLPQSNVCGFGSSLTSDITDTMITLTGGTLAPEASCTFSVTLTVPLAAATGSYPNTTGAVSGDVGGSPVTGNMASDTLFVAPAPVLTKEFTDDPVGAGDTVTLEFTITNTSSLPASDITFIDELTETGGFLPFPVMVSIPPGDPCGSGSSLALVSTGFDQQGLELTGGSLSGSGMCTFSVTVTIPTGFPAGTYTNRTEEITATVGMDTVTGNPASDDIVIVAAPSLLKEFTDDPVQPGDTVTLQYTLTHDEFAPGDATGITFTDDLAATLSGLTATLPPSPDPPCGPGSSLVGSAGDTFLTFMGATLMPGEMCTFSVTLTVPAMATPGEYTNTTSTVTATVLGVTATENAASDDLTIASLEFTKEFIDDPIIPGGTGTLRFTIVNTSASGDATGMFFTDDLDAALDGLVAVAPLPTDPCGSGSSISGTSFLFLTGGNLLAGEMCSFDVTVMVPTTVMGMPSDGSYNNVTSNLSATFDGNPLIVDPAVDALEVSSDLLLLTKEFTDDPVPPGGTATLRFTIENLDPANSASAIAFTDDLGDALAGLVPVGLPVSGCGGTASLTMTDTISFSGGSLGPAGTCFFDVSVSVPMGVPQGTNALNTTSDITGTISGLGVSGGPASDTLQVNSVAFTKSFDGPTVAGGNPVLTFTIQNLDTANPIGDLAFNDNLGAVLSGLFSVSGLQTNVCGIGSQISGTGLVGLSGGNLPAGGMCSFAITLQVPSGAAPGDYLNTTSNLNSGGVPVANPASDTLEVEPPPLFDKVFSPAFIGVGFASTLTFTIDNSASDVAASSLDFTDNLPAGVAVAGTPNATTTCTGGSITASPGGSVISYTGGTVGAGATCNVQVTVVGTAAGPWLNTTGDLTSSSGNSGTASDTLTVNPQPGFDKVFSPNPINLGGTSTLTFTIDNTGSTVDATSLNFSDALPTGVVIATPSNAATTCIGGMLTAMDGGTTISYTGGTVFDGTSCTVSVDVTSSVPDDHVNTSGDLTSSLGNSGMASDTLTVNPPPAFSKSFSPNPINAGQVSTLTFTIDNMGSTADADNLDFSDTLPTNVVIATPSGAATTCTGGSLTAPAGGSTISYTGGSVAAGASCNVSVDVTSSVPGTHMNESDDLTSSIGNSGTAADDLVVNAFTPLTFSKSFSPNPIDAGTTSVLTFTIGNANGVPIGNLDFSDTLPADVVIATPSNAATTCTGGTLTAPDGGSTISYTGGTVNGSSSCTVRVDVTSDVPGTHSNTSGDLTSDTGNSGMATDDLVVNDFELPAFSKSFSPTPIAPGATSTLTFTIDNSANQVDIGSLDFSDTLPTNVVIATPANASTTCSGGTLTAPDGGTTISYTGGTVSAASSCTVSVDVTSVVPGTYDNTSGDLTSDAGNSGTAAASLTVSDFGDVVFNKSFSPNPIDAGTTSTLTFTIDNSTNLAAVGNLDFSDTLPANVVIATPSNAATTCTGGTLTAPDGGSTISYTGGTVAASSSCTVTVDVTSIVPGTYMNVSGDLTSDAGNSGTAADDLVVNPLDPLAFGKAFAPNPIDAGDSSTLTFTIDNPNLVPVANIAFSDTLPADLLIATPANASTTCGATLTAPAGGSTISLSGGSVASSSSCTVSVDVTSAVASTYTNVSGDLTSDAGNSGTATANLTVDALPIVELRIIKSPNLQTVNSGQTATFTITLRNEGDETLSSLAVDDPLTPSCNRTAGSLPNLAPGANTSYNCTTDALTAGFVNRANGSAQTPSGDTINASDTAQVDVVSPDIEITKTPDTQSVDPGETATFTITITNQGSSTLTNIAVDDPLTEDCERMAGSLANLSPGQMLSYTCTTEPLFADLTNVATVTADGVDPQSDSAFVDVIAPIEITKEPNEQTVESGMTATFTITIDNPSSETRSNITVSDPATPDCARGAGEIADLGPGGSTSYTCTTDPLFNDLTNVAAVTAQDPGGNVLTDSDNALVTVTPGQLEATKEADQAVVMPGETVTFTITIRNLGGNMLSNITVDDPMTPSCDRAAGSLPDLGPGESTSYTCESDPLLADLINVATVTAEVGTGGTAEVTPKGPVQVVAVAVAVVLVANPDLAVTKTAMPAMVSPGLTATFTIEITNTGTVPVFDLEASDPLSPLCDRAVGQLPDLLPGESTSYSCSSLIVLSDFTNVVTVTGQRMGAEPLVSSASADVIVSASIEGIPTLSDFGLLVMLIILAGTGFMMLRR